MAHKLDADARVALALNGDKEAFQAIFLEFEPQLKSYLYRLVTNIHDAEDLAQDAFIKALAGLANFRGESSLKTWVFRIATNLAFDQQKRYKRWPEDTKARGKALCMGNSDVLQAIVKVHQASAPDAFEVRDHISHCFTCMSKTLEIEKQVALILKDVFEFKVKEIALIIDKSQDVVKHLLQDSRKTMTDIFDRRCALINKEGICNQCSELNGWFNPKQDRQAALMKLQMVRDHKKHDRKALYKLRTQLIKGIDPLESEGSSLQDVLMQCDRLALGEIEAMPQR